MATLTLSKIPAATLTAKHFHASGGTYTDTETDITYNGGSTVYVTVSIMPGLVYWTCPPAATIRKWVDDLLKGQPVKRDGARIEITGGSLRTWNFHYPVKPVTA